MNQSSEVCDVSPSHADICEGAIHLSIVMGGKDSVRDPALGSCRDGDSWVDNKLAGDIRVLHHPSRAAKSVAEGGDIIIFNVKKIIKGSEACSEHKVGMDGWNRQLVGKVLFERVEWCGHVCLFSEKMFVNV